MAGGREVRAPGDSDNKDAHVSFPSLSSSLSLFLRLSLSLALLLLLPYVQLEFCLAIATATRALIAMPITQTIPEKKEIVRKGCRAKA